MGGALVVPRAGADGCRVAALGAPADPSRSRDVCTVPGQAPPNCFHGLSWSNHPAAGGGPSDMWLLQP